MEWGEGEVNKPLSFMAGCMNKPDRKTKQAETERDPGEPLTQPDVRKMHRRQDFFRAEETEEKRCRLGLISASFS